jgi:transcription initiation factor TFIID subunit 13
MMYGFGDCWPPNSDSVELMEKLVANYVKGLCTRAVEVSELSGIKLDKECFMYVVKKDRKKFTRTVSLLQSNEELKKANKLQLGTEEDN